MTINFTINTPEGRQVIAHDFDTAGCMLAEEVYAKADNLLDDAIRASYKGGLYQIRTTVTQAPRGGDTVRGTDRVEIQLTRHI